MGASVFNSDSKRKILFYRDMSILRNNIPNAITSLRLVVLPHLIYLFNNQITLVAQALFLFAIGTDIADGYAARRLNSTSRFGSYLDVIVDFLFISGLYLNFVINQIYSPWILFIIVFVFSQFVLSNLYLKQTIYDPVGKYYGSLLFGGIGLTLLFSNQLVYDIVTYGIIISTLISLISRLIYFVRKKNSK